MLKILQNCAKIDTSIHLKQFSHGYKVLNKVELYMIVCHNFKNS